MKKSFSIRTYLGLSHTLLLVISLGAIGIIWSQNEYRVITEEIQGLMRNRINLLSRIIGHEYMEYGELKLDGPETASLIGQEENLLSVFIDPSGTFHELVPGTVSVRQEEIFRELSTQHPVYEESYVSLVHSDLEIDNVYAAAPVIVNDERIGTVCLLLPLGDLDAYILRLRWLLISAIFFVALLGVGISLLIANYFSRQFSQAQKLAATVANGNYQLRIPEDGPTELRDLSHYLNVMAEKQDEQLKMRQRLLSNVAHELARPLAGLQLGVESLRKGAIQHPDLADDLLVSMGYTIQRLEGLIDDVTLAAQPETNPIVLNRTAIAVEPFLQGVATRFWSLADSRGLKFKVRVEAGLPPVFADEKRLNQIIGNLVDNALKFTPHGKTIRLSAERADGENIRIVVHDGGKGISPDEAKHLFEPFYQGDIGRRIKQGMGLGLSIAQQLAQVHGGSLTLENHPKGGTLAILTLPTANA